jgi:hypothetical protein
MGGDLSSIIALFSSKRGAPSPGIIRLYMAGTTIGMVYKVSCEPLGWLNLSALVVCSLGGLSNPPIVTFGTGLCSRLVVGILDLSMGTETLGAFRVFFSVIVSPHLSQTCGCLGFP